MLPGAAESASCDNNGNAFSLTAFVWKYISNQIVWNSFRSRLFSQ